MKIEIENPWQAITLFVAIMLQSIGTIAYMTTSYYQGVTDQELQKQQTYVLENKIEEIGVNIGDAVKKLGNHETRISILEAHKP